MAKNTGANNWAKNVLKSFGKIATKSITDNYLEKTTEFFSSNYEELKEEIHNAKESKSFLGIKGDFAKEYVGMGKTALKNALEDLKSGKFYNEERLNNVSYGDDDDFDLDFDDDFDLGGDDDDDFSDFEDEDNDVTVNKKVTIVNANLSENSPVVRSLDSVKDAVVGTSEATNRVNASLSEAQIQTISAVGGNVSQGIQTINENISNIISFHQGPVSQFIEATSKYHEDSIRIMGEQLTELKKLSGNVEKKDEKENKDISDMFLNGFSFKDYIAQVGKQFGEATDSMGMGMGSMLKMALSEKSFFAENIASPISSLIGSMVTKVIIPETLGASMKAFDNTFRNFFPALLSKLAGIGEDYNANPIANFLGKVFGIQAKRKSSVDMSKYEKGAVPFDGYVRKSIVEVIPGHLRRIEAALTGEAERGYDYSKGQFRKVSDMRKEFDEDIEFRMLNEFSSRTSMVDMLNKLALSDAQRESTLKSIDKFFLKLANDSSVHGVAYNSDKNKERDKNRAGFEDLETFLSMNDIGNDKLLTALFRSLSNADKLGLVGSQRIKAIEAKAARLRESELNPFATNAHVKFDGSEIDRGFYEKNHIAYNDESVEVRNKKLSYRNKGLTDKFGNGQLDYLKDIRDILLSGIKVLPIGGFGTTAPTPGGPDILLPGGGRVTTGGSRPISGIEKELNEIKERVEKEKDTFNRNKVNPLENTLSEYQMERAEKEGKILPDELSEEEIIRALRSKDEVKAKEPGFFQKLFKNKAGEKISSVKEFFNNLLTVPAKFASEVFNKIDDGLYRIVFGVDEGGKENKDSFISKTFNLIKDKMGKLGRWLRERITGEDGVFSQMKDSTIGRTLLKFKESLLGDVDANGNRTGSILSETSNEMKDTLAGVKQFFTGKKYVDSKGVTHEATKDAVIPQAAMFFNSIKDSVKEKYFGKEELDENGNKKGIVTKALDNLGEGFNNIGVALFGPKYYEKDGQLYNVQGKQATEKLSETIKKRAPKALGIGTIGLGLGAVAGTGGFFGSLLLPGGPIGMAVVGTTLGFLSESESFKTKLFGKIDDKTGERVGGLISKSTQQFFKKNKVPIVGGMGFGALKGALFGNGLITRLLLGNGALGGAITGMAVSMVTRSKIFQDTMFGKEGEDGIRRGGLLSRFGKLRDDGNSKKVLGSMGAGAILGVGAKAVLSQFGILGNLIMPGGMIFSALAGSALGIAASSDKWRKRVFGDINKDTGKREGGLMGMLSNWLKLNVFTPVKLTAQEMSLNFKEWFANGIVDPFADAIGPIKRAIIQKFTNMGDRISSVAKWVGGKLSSGFEKVFGAKFTLLVDKLTSPVRKFFSRASKKLWGFTKMILGAPFKLLGKFGRHLAKKDDRRGLKYSLQERKDEFGHTIYERDRDGLIKGAQAMYDEDGNFTGYKTDDEGNIIGGRAKYERVKRSRAERARLRSIYKIHRTADSVSAKDMELVNRVKANGMSTEGLTMEEVQRYLSAQRKLNPLNYLSEEDNQLYEDAIRSGRVVLGFDGRKISDGYDYMADRQSRLQRNAGFVSEREALKRKRILLSLTRGLARENDYIQEGNTDSQLAINGLTDIMNMSEEEIRQVFPNINYDRYLKKLFHRGEIKEGKLSKMDPETRQQILDIAIQRGRELYNEEVAEQSENIYKAEEVSKATVEQAKNVDKITETVNKIEETGKKDSDVTQNIDNNLAKIGDTLDDIRNMMGGNSTQSNIITEQNPSNADLRHIEDFYDNIYDNYYDEQPEGGSGTIKIRGARSDLSKEGHSRIPSYYQNDRRWGSKRYSKYGNMATAGCGPTAMSMIAGGFGFDINPDQMSKLSQLGGFNDSTGTNSKFVSAMARQLKLLVRKTRSKKAAYDAIDDGPVLMNGKGKSGTPFTESGHYVVATGKDSNGNVLINDPRGKKYSKAYKPSDLKGMSSAWRFDEGGFGTDADIDRELAMLKIDVARNRERKEEELTTKFRDRLEDIFGVDLTDYFEEARDFRETLTDFINEIKEGKESIHVFTENESEDKPSSGNSKPSNVTESSSVSGNTADEGESGEEAQATPAIPQMVSAMGGSTGGLAAASEAENAPRQGTSRSRVSGQSIKNKALNIAQNTAQAFGAGGGNILGDIFNIGTSVVSGAGKLLGKGANAITKIASKGKYGSLGSFLGNKTGLTTNSSTSVSDSILGLMNGTGSAKDLASSVLTGGKNLLSGIGSFAGNMASSLLGSNVKFGGNSSPAPVSTQPIQQTAAPIQTSHGASRATVGAGAVNLAAAENIIPGVKLSAQGGATKQYNGLPGESAYTNSYTRSDIAPEVDNQQIQATPYMAGGMPAIINNNNVEDNSTSGFDFGGGGKKKKNKKDKKGKGNGQEESAYATSADTVLGTLGALALSPKLAKMLYPNAGPAYNEVVDVAENYEKANDAVQSVPNFLKQILAAIKGISLNSSTTNITNTTTVPGDVVGTDTTDFVLPTEPSGMPSDVYDKIYNTTPTTHFTLPTSPAGMPSNVNPGDTPEPELAYSKDYVPGMPSDVYNKLYNTNTSTSTTTSTTSKTVLPKAPAGAPSNVVNFANLQNKLNTFNKYSKSYKTDAFGNGLMNNALNTAYSAGKIGSALKTINPFMKNMPQFAFATSGAGGSSVTKVTSELVTKYASRLKSSFDTIVDTVLSQSSVTAKSGTGKSIKNSLKKLWSKLDDKILSKYLPKIEESLTKSASGTVPYVAIALAIWNTVSGALEADYLFHVNKSEVTPLMAAISAAFKLASQIPFVGPILDVAFEIYAAECDVDLLDELATRIYMALANDLDSADLLMAKADQKKRFEELRNETGLNLSEYQYNLASNPRISDKVVNKVIGFFRNDSDYAANELMYETENYEYLPLKNGNYEVKSKLNGLPYGELNYLPSTATATGFHIYGGDKGVTTAQSAGGAAMTVNMPEKSEVKSESLKTIQKNFTSGGTKSSNHIYFRHPGISDAEEEAITSMVQESGARIFDSKQAWSYPDESAYYVYKSTGFTKFSSTGTVIQGQITGKDADKIVADINSGKMNGREIPKSSKEKVEELYEAQRNNEALSLATFYGANKNVKKALESTSKELEKWKSASKGKYTDDPKTIITDSGYAWFLSDGSYLVVKDEKHVEYYNANGNRLKDSSMSIVSAMYLVKSGQAAYYKIDSALKEESEKVVEENINNTKSLWKNGRTTQTTMNTHSTIPGMPSNVYSVAAGGGGFGETVNDFPYYSQNDSEWANKIYGQGGKDSNTMSKSGCGPTAMAMISEAVTGNETSPLDVASYTKKKGYNDKTGTNWNFVDDTANHYGMVSRDINPSNVQENLANGRPVLLSGNGGSNTPYTKRGHYVVATGLDENGNILINDPRGKSYSRAFSPEILEKTTNRAWSFGASGGFGDTKKKKKNSKKKKKNNDNTVTVNMGGNAKEARQAVVNHMAYRLQNKIAYSQNNRNVDSGSGDCSSLCQWCYNKAIGLDPGSNSRLQAQSSKARVIWQATSRGERIPEGLLMPGDLIFMSKTGLDKSSINHVGMYMGNDTIAEHGGGSSGVEPGPNTTKMSTAYTGSQFYVCVCRYIEDGQTYTIRDAGTNLGYTVGDNPNANASISVDGSSGDFFSLFDTALMKYVYSGWGLNYGDDYTTSNVTESVAGTPADLTGDYIGKHMKRFESGDKGPLAMAHCGNDGGMSYGTYQMIWSNGTGGSPGPAQRFWDKYYASKYGKPASYDDLVNKWTTAVNTEGVDKFAATEHQYMLDNFYKPEVKDNKSVIDIDNYSRALQEIAWASSVADGPGYGSIKNAIKRTGKSVGSMSENELINSIYDYKVSIDPTHYRSSPEIIDAMIKRHNVDERKVMLGLSGNPPINPDTNQPKSSTHSSTPGKPSNATGGGFGDELTDTHVPIYQKPVKKTIEKKFTTKHKTFMDEIPSSQTRYQKAKVEKKDSIDRSLINEILVCLNKLVSNSDTSNTTLDKINKSIVDTSGNIINSTTMLVNSNGKTTTKTKPTKSSPTVNKDYQLAKRISQGRNQ